MGDDHNNFSHKRYAQRLAEIEKRERERKQQYHAHRHQQSEAIGNKLPKLKKQRTSRTFWRACLLLGFFLIIFGSMLFIASPLSRVGKMTVTGNQSVSDTAVIKATGITTRDFMWGINGRSTAVSKKATRQNPRLKHVTIKAVGFRTIKLVVTENNLIGSVYRNGVYWPVLSSG